MDKFALGKKVSVGAGTAVRTALGVAAVGLLLGGAGPASATPVVTNGNFEASGGCFVGWTQIDAGDQLCNPGHGGRFVEIGGFGGGSSNAISQLVSGFNPGSTYTLYFSIASQWVDGSSGAEVEVSFLSGSSTASQDFFAPPAVTSNAWDMWQTFSYDFVASAASVDIQFLQVTHGFNDVGIDDISIPEPASLALLGLGLAGLGFSRRRKA